MFFFFFNDTATTEIYTLSLHDALPIYRRGRHDRPRVRPHDRGGRHDRRGRGGQGQRRRERGRRRGVGCGRRRDRKSTRLNSSHANISYAVFCLKKKNNKYQSVSSTSPH